MSKVFELVSDYKPSGDQLRRSKRFWMGLILASLIKPYLV